jgi:exopolyphosphatase/guanosine-5'-triphosphate,3'-diphosphate pyrophosphatase
MSDQHAIIDIGSNTVRLVVFDGPSRAPSVLLNEKVTAKLGKDVAKTGMLSEKAMGVALSALSRYAALLRAMAVKDVQVVATAAARDAPNGPQFLDAVRQTGLSPRLLSGEEEALTSAWGVLAAFPGAKGVAADLGGGSLELTELYGASCSHGITMPYGTLRLPDLRAGGSAKFGRQVHAALRKADWSSGTAVPLYLVGGSWRAFARYAIHQLSWPIDDPHGFELLPEEALSVCRSIAQGKLSASLPRISASRLGSLPDAAALLGALLREIRPSKLVFSSWGLREGLLYRKLPPAAQAQDPMLAGVTAFAESHGVSAGAATRITGWTAPLCPGDEREERLRLAATMLALAAMQIEPNMRTEQAMNWALRKRWIGLDARGRAMAALTILANSGSTSIPPELTGLAAPADFRQAIGWGLAVRLCRKLTGCTVPGLAGTAVATDGTRLTLTLHDPMHALYSNAIGKDHRLLAEWFGLEPAVALVG